MLFRSQPEVTNVTLNNVAISVKDNFTVTYGENVAMGEGTITLTPKNANFTGTKTITFKITGQMLKNGDFKFYDANGLTTTLSHKYDGTAYAPAKTVFDTTSTKVRKYNTNTDEAVGTRPCFALFDQLDFCRDFDWAHGITLLCSIIPCLDG